MAEISGSLVQYSFGVRHVLCWLASVRSTVFGRPVTEATVPETKSNAECEAFSQTDILKLFADDLRQATEWHVSHRKQSRVPMAVRK